MLCVGFSTEEAMLRPDPNLHVEIFAIGTEVLLGRIQDTNSAWLAEQISMSGGTVRRITALGDSAEDIRGGFGEAIARGAGLAVSTGGLGTTPDDITVEVVAGLAGCGVKSDDRVIADYRARRSIPEGDDLPPALLKMGSVPEKADAYLNPVGWAPGFSVRMRQTCIFCMPGPPREVKGVYDAHLRPALGAAYRGLTAVRRVRTEMFESQISPVLQEVMNRFPNAYLKAYVALGDGTGLPVDVFVRGSDGQSPERELENVLGFFAELMRMHGKELKPGA